MMENYDTDKRFDDSIRSKISKGTTLPDEILWKRLNDQLVQQNESSSRRKFFFWGLGSFGVLLIIGAALTAVLTPSSNGRESLLNNAAIKSSRSNLEGERKALVTSNIDEKKSEFESHKLNEYKSALNANTKVQNDLHSTDNQIENYTSKGTIDKMHNEASNHNVINSNNDQFSIVASEESNASNSFRKNESMISDDNNIIVLKEGDNSASEDILTSSKNVERLPLLAGQLLETTVVAEIEEHAISNIESLTVAPVKKWYIGGSLNPSYSYRSISSNETDDESEVEDYQENEGGRFNLNFGIDAGYSINRYLRVRSGISFLSYSCDYKANNSALYYDTLGNRLEVQSSLGNYYIDEGNFDGENENNQNGDFNEENEDFVSINYSNIQRLSYLQIPLSIEFGLTHNKMRYFGALGISYNRLISERMDFKMDGYKSIRTTHPDLAAKNLFTQSVELGVDYLINSNLAITFAPKFSYSLSQINRDNTISSKPFWLGINCSVKYFIK